MILSILKGHEYAVIKVILSLFMFPRINDWIGFVVLKMSM